MRRRHNTKALAMSVTALLASSGCAGRGRGRQDRPYSESYEGEPLGPAEAAVEDVPHISPETTTSLEAIIGQQPNVVVTYGLSQTTPEDLAEAGIATLFESGYCGGSDARSR